MRGVRSRAERAVAARDDRLIAASREEPAVPTRDGRAGENGLAESNRAGDKVRGAADSALEAARDAGEEVRDADTALERCAAVNRDVGDEEARDLDLGAADVEILEAERLRED